MSLEAELGLLCSPRSLTYVYDLPKHPSPLFLGPGWRPHVHASTVSSQNFLASRLTQSVSQNWSHFLSSQNKKKASRLTLLYFRALGPSPWLVQCLGSFLELCRHHWLPCELDSEPMLLYRACLLPYKEIGKIFPQISLVFFFHTSSQAFVFLLLYFMLF